VTESKERGAGVRLPPPLVYLAAVVLGGVLEWLWRISLPLGGSAGVVAGLVIGGLGVAAVAAAFGLFRSTGQDPAPWEPTPEIVSTGIYRFTRNPMYVGMGLLQAGIGIGFASGWILLLSPISLVVVYWTAVRHEEAYLEGKFGEAYLGYKARVRRWL
jgi:protein-S-isoprenylcysteine O-methyltransferase Ste14